jgi:kelch-like protein 12
MNYDNIKQKCNFKHKILFSGEIYVCGGFDGYNRHTSMECYNPKTDQWRTLSGMAVGREGAGLVIAGDNIYCVGGYDGINLLDSAEKYDPDTEQWSNISPMSCRRSGKYSLYHVK